MEGFPEGSFALSAQMEKYLADTHALVWYMEDDHRLGQEARAVLEKMNDGSALIFLSLMSLLEMDYLIQKKKISPKLPDLILQEAKPAHSALQIVDIGLSLYPWFLEVPSSVIPELPDRILAATALSLSCPLITKDSVLSRWKKLEVVW